MKFIVSFQTGNVLKMTSFGHGENSLSEFSIVVCLAIKSLWMWGVTL